MKGLAKKAFDISQLTHLTHYLTPETIKHTMLMSAPGMGLEGVKRFVGNRGGDLLNTGIEMGKNNQQMNPIKHTIASNFLGRSKMAPYHAGLQIGNDIRSQGLVGEDEQKYIQGILDQKAKEREVAAAAHKKGKVKDNTLKAFENYETGAFNHHNAFNSVINAGAISQKKNTKVQNAVAQAISAPVAKFIDPTAIVRPALNKVESTKRGSEGIDKIFPQGSARGNMYSKVRRFID